MNRAVRRSLSEVDVIVFVVAAARYTDEDAAVASILPENRPVIVAINKIDQLKDRSALLPLIERMRRSVPAAAYIPVSAQRGTQLDLLLDEILALLPQQPALFPDDQLTDRDERFFAAEFVREKLFRQLGDEVPYGLTVVVDRFEQIGELRRINASVLVDKASHRAIVLGEGGARIKAVGTSARKDMEALFGGKVYLQLWVKVRTGWAEDAGELKRLGYA
jgi:GTPase